MIQAKKHFGQNFLVSRHHLDLLEEKFVKFIEITNPTEVLEIGPGMGALTEIIVNKFDGYTECWEIDPEAIDFLENSYIIDKINLIQRDAIEFLKPASVFNSSNLKNFVLVSNLPYNVGSRVMIDLACLDIHPNGFLVMLQKEVGQKLISKSKNISVLGGFLCLFYDFKLLADFPRSAFSPQPNVVSVLAQGIHKKTLRNFLIKNNRNLVLETLKKLLIYPSKTLANNLKNLNWSKEQLSDFYNQNQLDINLRMDWTNYEYILEIVLERSAT